MYGVFCQSIPVIIVPHQNGCRKARQAGFAPAGATYFCRRAKVGKNRPRGCAPWGAPRRRHKLHFATPAYWRASAPFCCSSSPHPPKGGRGPPKGRRYGSGSLQGSAAVACTRFGFERLGTPPPLGGSCPVKRFFASPKAAAIQEMQTMPPPVPTILHLLRSRKIFPRIGKLTVLSFPLALGLETSRKARNRIEIPSNENRGPISMLRTDSGIVCTC